MTKEEFITTEIKRFDADAKHPFRVAVGGTPPGCYPYGSHTEPRFDYADVTIGYATIRSEAIVMLGHAYDFAEAENRR